MTAAARRWARAAFAALLAALAGSASAACSAGAREDVPTAADTLADGRAISRLTTDAIAQAPAVRRESPVPGGPPAIAAPADSTAADAAGRALTVSLVTIGQGEAVWERFGHNAIRIRDAVRGTDVAYNWGMFDFAQPNFIARFLTGDTRYWMEGFDAPALIAHYVRVEGRSVWEQELALTPVQRAALRDYVEWNAREENRYYRYDYYRDNCSTRVRDALDRALGGVLRRVAEGRPTGTTWRSHTRRLVAGDAAIYTGIQLALGRPADRPIDRWSEGFLPTRLMEHVRAVRVRDAAGRPVPLVTAERTLYAAPRPGERATPPSYAAGYAAVGLALLAVLVLLGRATARGGRAAGAGLAVVGGLWLLVAGALGTALTLAGTVTRHAAYMGRNENLLLVNPLHLLLAVPLVIVALRAGRAAGGALARGTRVLAAAAAALAALGLVVQLLPGVGQRSWEAALLFAPAHLGVWWALAAIAREARPASTPARARA